MTTKTQAKHIAKLQNEIDINNTVPVPQPCGCLNHIGGEIEYCKRHTASFKACAGIPTEALLEAQIVLFIISRIHHLCKLRVPKKKWRRAIAEDWIKTNPDRPDDFRETWKYLEMVNLIPTR